MRENHSIQLSLLPVALSHPLAQEMEAVSRVLDAQPTLAEWVAQDLAGERSAKTGRPGMSGELALRALVLKQMRGWTYEELSFELEDSRSTRRFVRLGLTDKAPSASTLQSNLSSIREETLERIHRALVGQAVARGVDRGRRVRIDSTPVETTIHAPDDAAQLWDTVRVLTRLMKRARERAAFCFHDRTRASKRRRMEVMHAKDARSRKRAYRRLIRHTEEVLGFANCAIAALEGRDQKEDRKLLEELQRFAELGQAVVEQTRRRVLQGERVPHDEKVVSIFEPHTDILPKGRREVKFGHKVFLSVGASSLVLDVFVGEGNPADSALAPELVQRTTQALGRVPEQVAFDGGFASKANLQAIREQGVTDVCFSKGRGLEVSEMVRSSALFKKLRRFRAGVEGVISFLKRGFGLDRCTWRGEQGFRRYVLASVIAANLVVLGRHAMS